jgi:hypothetical protein
MYPVRLGFEGALKRIQRLASNEHHAEALVTSVFTIEKTMRRVLRALVVSAGFSSSQAKVLMSKFDGLGKVKEVWECFDPKSEKLSAFTREATLQTIAEAQKMRNELVHGSKVFDLDHCKRETERTLEALRDLRNTFRKRYGYDGWTKIKLRNKSVLHSDPRIRIR